MSTTYPSDLTDGEWQRVQRYLPPLPTRGRPRIHSLRRILNAIFYVLRTGCAWRYLPSNFPPWQTVFYHFRRFRLKGTWHLLYTALHRAERERMGRTPDPSGAIMDSQSVKTVEESACIRGYDSHKCVKGRKRHLLVDTLGLPIASYITPADVHDTVGARKLLGGLAYFVPRLKKIWADAAYRGKELAEWCQQQGLGWELEIVERAAGVRGFSVQPRRWVVERTQPHYPQSSLDVQYPACHDRAHRAAKPPPGSGEAARSPGLWPTGRWCAMPILASPSSALVPAVPASTPPHPRPS